MIRASFFGPIRVAAVVLALALGGCGQKGPLKLPEPAKPADPAKPAEPAKPEPAQPTSPK